MLAPVCRTIVNERTTNAIQLECFISNSHINIGVVIGDMIL